MPALAALAYHRASGRSAAPPSQRLSYAENFLYMLDAGATPNYRPNPRLTRAIDIMFTLHAEHEMNCSTAAARHLASSGVDVYTAIGGAGDSSCCWCTILFHCAMQEQQLLAQCSACVVA